MSCAQTGSGKTAAFLVPTCSVLFGQAANLIHRNKAYNPRSQAKPLVLVLAPTRELCCQIFDEARRVCTSYHICQISTIFIFNFEISLHTEVCFVHGKKKSVGS